MTGHTQIASTATSMTIDSMDAVVEFPWMDLQRVIDVAVQQPAPGNESR
ncbi:hypothetical protein [Shewanella sp. NFH-SH190041]|nr:hypothetical protein [Shewanella sp. NFH-SH190041]